ncbi:Uncharacterised protein [Phocoenobacter uteri]|uniref:Uncharacterized protein n=1 Tax=Phocoenobacter uteri TaxID=146806 RepID=A0A379CAH1_9PAST|nr:hypothetical protein [Phocoenobacter uteri]MDG6882505.1 hypothetical protein [Phocoenobacter uteri]SUB58667.1 Uncharacterised protein [Phocoenobacter uteri]
MVENTSIENIALNLKYISELLESSSVLLPEGIEDDEILNLIRFFLEKVGLDLDKISSDLLKIRPH